MKGGATRTLPLGILLLFATGGGFTTPDAELLRTTLLDRLPFARIAVYGFENLLMPFSKPTRDPQQLGKALGTVARFIAEGEQPVSSSVRRATLPAPRNRQPMGNGRNTNPWNDQDMRTVERTPPSRPYSPPTDGSIRLEKPMRPDLAPPTYGKSRSGIESPYPALAVSASLAAAWPPEASGRWSYSVTDEWV